MPELPEVETIRRDLARSVRGLKILNISVFDQRVIRQKQGQFLRRVAGRRILDVGRRGKALILDLGGMFLIIQPMMTGQLIVSSSGSGVSRDTRLVFSLSKRRTLVYNDQRLFGRLEAVATPDEHRYLRSLGPEPLARGFTVEVLAQSLAGRKSAIKTALMDARVVAGIGNIYAAEILFSAGISPRRAALSLTPGETGKLHRMIRSVLERAVRLRGTSVRNYRDGHGQPGKYLKVVRVYGREGQPCRVCGGTIRRIVQAQRSTFYCRDCQS